MKLKDYAKQQGISYKTAWRWWKAGKLPGHQMDTGTILVDTAPQPVPAKTGRVAIYARVSSHEHAANLERQAERLVSYCASRGYQVCKSNHYSGENHLIILVSNAPEAAHFLLSRL